MFGRLDEDESRLSEVRLEAGEIKQDISGLQAEKIALDKDKGRMDSEMSDLRSQIDELNRMQAKKDQAEKDIANQNDNLEKLRGMIKKDREQMEDTDRAIKECRRVALPTEKSKDDLEDMRRAALERDRNMHVIQSQISQHRGDLDTLRSGLDGKESPEIQKIVDGLEADVLADDRALQEAEQAIRDAVGRAGEKTSEIKMLAGSLDRASSLGQRCEYCNSALSPDYVTRLQSDRRAKLDAARAVLATMEQNRQQAEGEAQKTRHRLNQDRDHLAERRKDLEAANKIPGLVQTIGRLGADFEDARGRKRHPAGGVFSPPSRGVRPRLPEPPAGSASQTRGCRQTRVVPPTAEGGSNREDPGERGELARPARRPSGRFRPG